MSILGKGGLLLAAAVLGVFVAGKVAWFSGLIAGNAIAAQIVAYGYALLPVGAFLYMLDKKHHLGLAALVAAVIYVIGAAAKVYPSPLPIL